MRGRGLKPEAVEVLDDALLSPPVRGRGLKHASSAGGVHSARSPPVRGRGLKPGELGDDRVGAGVAPRAGARIETDNSRQDPNQAPGRPPCGGAD